MQSSINQFCEDKKEITVTICGKTFNFKAMSEKEEAEWNDYKERQRIEENKRRIERLKISSLMDENFKEKRFENFDLKADNKQYFEIAKYYSDNFESMLVNNTGLIFYGEPGVGKSYLSFCIANSLLDKGISVIATTLSILIKKIKEISSFGVEDESKFYNTLKTVKLLVIDDLGVDYKNEWVISKIYEVIDARYRSGLPVIITTNLKPIELKNELTGKDEVARTFDRIVEMCRPINMRCEPRRLSIARAKNEEFEKLIKGISWGA